MRNHKLFFLFLLYTTFACFYALALTARFLVHLHRASPGAAAVAPPAAGAVALSSRATVAVAILTPAAVVVALTAGLGAALLLGWNVACISRNRTTVEAHRCDDTTAHFVAPSYNRGLAANWRHVMGPTLWLWPLPIMEPRSGGGGGGGGGRNAAEQGRGPAAALPRGSGSAGTGPPAPHALWWLPVP